MQTLIYTPLAVFKWFFNLYYKFFPPEMVQHWKKSEAVEALPMMAEDGSYCMKIRGEKYLMPGFPRGHVLMGPLADFKKLVKNEIFNKGYALLDKGMEPEVALETLWKESVPTILSNIQAIKHHMMPQNRMLRPVRELHRALTAVEHLVPSYLRAEYKLLRDGLTFFLQEDDAYRYRMQWISPFFNPNVFYRRIFRAITFSKYSLMGELKFAASAIRNAEVTEDMKLRVNLIERVASIGAKIPDFDGFVNALMKEIDWKKLKLNKAEKFYFRAKYFKVDHGHFDY